MLPGASVRGSLPARSSRPRLARGHWTRPL